MPSKIIRCPWSEGDPLMTAYHDREWGVPVHDDRRHFEFLILEGAQAGLSWSTILVATKADVANPDKLKKLKSFAARRKLPFYTISAVTGEGIDKLKYAIAEAVAEHRTHDPLPPPEPAIYKTPKPKPAYPPPLPSAKAHRR